MVASQERADGPKISPAGVHAFDQWRLIVLRYTNGGMSSNDLAGQESNLGCLKTQF